MDFSIWPEIQQSQYQHHQISPTPPTDPYSQFYNAPPPYQNPSYDHYSYYSHPHPLNPNSNLKDPQTNPKYEIPPAQFDSNDIAIASETILRPPGLDTYAPNQYLPHVGYDGLGTAPYGHHPSMQSGPEVGPSQFPDSNAQPGWAAKEAIRQFGVDTVASGVAGRHLNTMEPMAGANPLPTFGLHHLANGAVYRRPKKTKVVQPAWCEVCKLDCNSEDVLNKHTLGKRHKRNLQKLEESKKEANSTVKPSNSIVGKKETSLSKGKTVATLKAVKKRGATAAVAGDDLETKRQKLMEGGASADSVRVCVVCNVACNSETVFNYHMTGQKHATQVKKQAAMGMAMAAGPRFITAI